MKCPTCGANLQIEDEKCPFCRNPNPFAVKHRQQMRHYQQEFQETKREVEKKARHFNSLTAKITVIAVLFVMIIGMVYMGNEGPYRIWSGRVKHDIAVNAEEYKETLSAYEKEGDWLSLYAFYEARNLGHTDAFREYSILYFVIFDYKNILNCVTRYRMEPEEGTAAVCADRIAQHLDSFYKTTGRISYESAYYDGNFTPEHQEAYARLREEIEALLSAYCGLTKEELALLPDYSVSKKGSLIEEGLLRYEEERKMTDK